MINEHGAFVVAVIALNGEATYEKAIKDLRFDVRGGYKPSRCDLIRSARRWAKSIIGSESHEADNLANRLLSEIGEEPISEAEFEHQLRCDGSHGSGFAK